MSSPSSFSFDPFPPAAPLSSSQPLADRGRMHFTEAFNKESSEQPEPLRRKLLSLPAHPSPTRARKLLTPASASPEGVGWAHLEPKSSWDEYKPSSKFKPQIPTLSGPECLFASSGKRILNLARQRSSEERSLEDWLGANRRIDPELVRMNPDGRAGGRPIRNTKLEQIEYSRDFFKLGASRSFLAFEGPQLKEKKIRENLWKQNRTRNEPVDGDQLVKRIPYTIVQQRKALDAERLLVAALPDEVKVNEADIKAPSDKIQEEKEEEILKQTIRGQSRAGSRVGARAGSSAGKRSIQFADKR